ncbi:T6SS effector BTH_I2691 family protein [Acinetobacter sp. ESBL14]|uniref:T6SS effector BTH_I2691 family protein n=1 Tax=Acinetobacter sp. ESBL14 TaxID=3077329 RepID=UPI002FCCB80F
MNNKVKVSNKYLDANNNKNISQKLAEENKSKQITMPENTISESSRKILTQNLNSSTTDKKCSTFCREEGFHILPLRYAVTQQKAPTLATSLGANVKSVKLQHSSYVAEMLDSGYVYQLVVRSSGRKEWYAYKVTPKGYLSLFPIGKTAPVSVPEFACKSATHTFMGSLITVPHNPKDKEKTTYLLYTHVALTQNKIKQMEQNPESFVQKGMWQKIDVEGWKGGNMAQQHCLNHQNLKTSIHNLNSFGNRIQHAFKQFNSLPKFYASIVLYDPVGITVALNDFRNLAYAPVDEYLNIKDAMGISNQRKLDAAQQVDNLKGALAGSIQKFHTSREQETRTPLDGRLQGRLLTLNEMSQAAAKRGDIQEVERIRLRKQEVLREHEQLLQRRGNNAEQAIRLDTKASWQTCDENLNYAEVEAFKAEAAKKYDTALIVANQRAMDHLNWINSESLLDGLEVYDNTDLQNGCAFKSHVAAMLFGMEGATQAAEQIDRWIIKPQFERGNLFIRGLYSNQNEAKKLHEEIVAKATDFTAVGIKAVKGVVDFLKKTDSAWDEWVRNQNKNNIGNLAFSNTEKKSMLFVSNFARTVFRVGMGTQTEKMFVKAISQKLLFAQMGELAAKLRFDQVVHNIDPEKQKIADKVIRVAPQLGTKVASSAQAATLASLDVLLDDAMQKKTEVARKLEQILGQDMKNATNNYHQVRASGILVLLESINLATMLSSGKYKTGEQIAALTASVAALMAFALDIFYGLGKGVREVATQTTYSGAGAAATRAAANIQRAAIKWVAGSLSAVAGSISAWLDFQKFTNLGSKVGTLNSLKVLYFARGVSGAFATILGLFAALTYIGPLMDYLKRVGGSPAIQRLGGYLFGQKALLIFKNFTREAVRNVLLRGIAWASGIGLVLTLAEIGLLVYMEATKLQRWCEHSVFRQNKGNQLMSETQELEDYYKIFV